MKYFLPTSLYFLIFLTASVFSEDEDALRFAKIFTDKMVLQQEKPIKVWGWAKSGASVRLTLTQDVALGKKAESKAGIETSRSDGDGEYNIRVHYTETNAPKLETKASVQRQDGWSLVHTIPSGKSQFSTDMADC